MKVNELLSNFTIALSNEEAKVLETLKGIMPLQAFGEREQFIIENLIRKSMISKIMHNGNVLVTKNDRPTDS